MLVMLERPGCGWCRAWHQEIGAVYPLTEEGRRAPLRRVDLDQAWPPDLPELTPTRFTPTFVVVRGGREIGRLIGHLGNDYFWGMLDEILSRP
ncbi:MAG: thioredoxin family protein [Azospirillum sp.]|nr:thioredoxin family protein [Azospirillum sp.]